MALRVPDFITFLLPDPANRELWYRFFTTTVNDLPQNGNASPEGVIRANKSCLYIQDNGGSTTLWFNTVGNGSATGWVVK